MTRHSKVWMVLAVVFVGINLGGGAIAAAQGELLHMLLHAGLLLVGALVVRRLAASRAASRLLERDRSALTLPGEVTTRLTRLEQAIDAVAIEVERIGEGQRYITNLLTENGTRALGERSTGT